MGSDLSLINFHERKRKGCTSKSKEGREGMSGEQELHCV